MTNSQETVAELVAKVKQYQRRGEEFKQRWYSYVQGKGSPNYDPNRHDIFTLRDFLAKVERNEVQIDESIRSGSHLNAAEAAKAQLVGQVKAFQRLGEDYKQKWYTFLHTKGSIHYDPNRQDIGLLKEFLVKHDAEHLGLPRGAAGGEAVPEYTPEMSANIQEYMVAYQAMSMSMAVAAGAASASSVDPSQQHTSDLMNWNSTSALNYDKGNKDTAEAEAWAQRVAGAAAGGPGAEQVPFDAEMAAAAAAALSAAGDDPEAAAAAAAVLQAQGVSMPFMFPSDSAAASADANYSESFDTMSFGKRPLSMRQYDPEENEAAAAAQAAAVAAAEALAADVATPEAQATAEVAEADAAVAAADAAVAAAADPGSQIVAQAGADRAEEEGGRRRRREEGGREEGGRRRSRDRERRRDRSGERPRRRDRSAQRDRSREKATEEGAAKKRKSGWDDKAPGEGTIANMLFPGGPPPQPGMGMPPPQFAYPPGPLGQNPNKPGAKDWSAGFADETGHKPPKGRPGDWICPACKNINFSSRKICHNDKCKGTAVGAERIGLKPGDWICPTCGDLVFASKSKCKMCQTPKQVGQGAPAGSPPTGAFGGGGDWVCPACGDHQFARNFECRLCKAPRPQQMGKGKGGPAPGQPMMNVAFDPMNPLESVNASAANFDPNFDPNAVAPPMMQTNWNSFNGSSPAMSSGAPAFDPAMGSAGVAPAGGPNPASFNLGPAPQLNPVNVLNWNIATEDKWAQDGWVETPGYKSSKWKDKKAGGEWVDLSNAPGWQDLSDMPGWVEMTDDPSTWAAAGWNAGKSPAKAGGWK